MISSRVPPRRRVVTAVEAIRTSKTWSSPTRLKLWESARIPWISCACTAAAKTCRRVIGSRWPVIVFRLRKVSDRQDRSKIVRRMSPFRGQESVIKIKPADHRSDIESGADRIKLVRSTWVRANRPDNSHPERFGPSNLVHAGYWSAWRRSQDYQADRAEPFPTHRDAHKHRSRHSRRFLAINGLDRGRFRPECINQ